MPVSSIHYSFMHSHVYSFISLLICLLKCCCSSFLVYLLASFSSECTITISTVPFIHMCSYIMIMWINKSHFLCCRCIPSNFQNVQHCKGSQSLLSSFHHPFQEYTVWDDTLDVTSCLSKGFTNVFLSKLN